MALQDLFTVASSLIYANHQNTQQKKGLMFALERSVCGEWTNSRELISRFSKCWKRRIRWRKGFSLYWNTDSGREWQQQEEVFSPNFKWLKVRSRIQFKALYEKFHRTGSVATEKINIVGRDQLVITEAKIQIVEETLARSSRTSDRKTAVACHLGKRRRIR